MPNQVVPITGFDQVGVILDSPPVSLPPNALSDVRNVRFKDGAVRKMEGEVNLFPNLFDGDGVSYNGDILKYVVWWPNPNIIDDNRGYYLIIVEQDYTDTDMVNHGQRDVAYLLSPGSTARHFLGHFQRDELANWQHTFFQGGFAMVINNGLDEPHYIIDSDGNTDITRINPFEPLPGWESYEINQTVISDTFSAGNTGVFTIGNPVDFDNFRVMVTIAGADPIMVTGVGTFDSVTYSVVNNLATLTFDTLPNVGDLVTIRIESRMPVSVRAGVIRAFGDFLVAGDLFEFTTDDMTNERTILRNLAGIVRTSDVAAPGEIPTNWNPFAAGVSTADEFVLTASGVVQEMVELQGSLYIYSNSSISIMRQTGNAQVPLSVTPVTES